VIRCPLTSILIIFEMTRNYSIILPLMAGNMIAYAISVRLRPVSVYSALLVQDGVSLKRMPSYRGERDWRNLPVSTIMTHDVVVLNAGTLTSTAVQGTVSVKRHHAYPVLDEQGLLVGIITRHELVDAAQADEATTVGQLLAEKRLVTVQPETSIREAARILVLGEVEQAPVVSRSDPTRLLGIVTLHDIARQQNAIEEKEES
jgi:chloride channel protein, CIC family